MSQPKMTMELDADQLVAAVDYYVKWKEGLPQKTKIDVKITGTGAEASWIWTRETGDDS